jgi:hypothetical protein
MGQWKQQKASITSDRTSDVVEFEVLTVVTMNAYFIL